MATKFVPQQLPVPTYQPVPGQVSETVTLVDGQYRNELGEVAPVKGIGPARVGHKGKPLTEKEIQTMRDAGVVDPGGDGLEGVQGNLAPLLRTGADVDALLDKHKNNWEEAAKDVGWWGQARGINREVLRRAALSRDRVDAESQLGGRLRAADPNATIGYGDSVEQVERRIEEIDSRGTRRKEADNANAKAQNLLKQSVQNLNKSRRDEDNTNKTNVNTAETNRITESNRQGERAVDKQYEEFVRQENDKWRRHEAKMARFDAAQLRADNLELELAKLEANERISKRDFEYREQDRLMQSILALAQSSSGLGAAFTL